jgi:hypothetical protein
MLVIQVTKESMALARDIVCQWKFKGKGCDNTMPFSDHDLNPLAQMIAEALDAAKRDVPNWPSKEEFMREAHDDCPGIEGVDGAEWAYDYLSSFTPNVPEVVLKALEWYSKRENWKLVDFSGEIMERIDPSDLSGEGYMCCSGGKRARQALKALEEEQ